jgi:hypothetical protein
MKFIYRMLTYYICFILCVCAQMAVAQSDVRFVNEFLNIGVGARAHGMFGSVAASTTDVTAGYWNPAALSQVNEPFQVSAMHASWFGGIANYDYIGLGKTFGNKNNAFGSMTFIRMGVDNIPNTLNLIGPDGTVDFDRVTNFSAADYALLISFGQKLGDSGFSLGGSSKFIYRDIGSFGSAFGFGFDLGAIWKKNKFTLAVMGRDITTTINNWSFSLTPQEAIQFEKTGNAIPISSTEIALPKLVIAGAYKFGDPARFTYLIESDIRFSSDGTKSGVFSGENIGIDPTFGFELGYHEQVFFRFGVGNIQRTINETSDTSSKVEFQPNVGLGISLGRVNVDYALTNIGSTSGVLVSHIFSLSIDFDDR